MPTTQDDHAVLIEIRDLLREQSDYIRRSQETIEREKKSLARSQKARMALNVLVICFVAAASYVYYHTLVTAFPH